MTYVLLAVGAVALLVLLLGWWNSRPYPHRLASRADLEPFFETLVEQCADGSLLFIEHPGSDRFLQFALYRFEGGGGGIRISFPDAPWSRTYVEGVKETLSSQGLPVRLDMVDTPPVRAFVASHLPLDAARAAEVASLLLDSLELPQDETLQVRYDADLKDPSLKTSLRMIRDELASRRRKQDSEVE